MPPVNADQQLWEDEQVLIAPEKKINPDLFRDPVLPAEYLNRRIGIHTATTNLPKGYVKYSPLDFIVEEILPDGTPVNVLGNEPALEADLPGEGTIYCTLIKVGLSTLDAIIRITEALSLDYKNIGYAGIKDAVALTGQRISIRGTTIDQVKAITLEDILLRDIVEGKGAISLGSLKGNRFTILVRTESPVDESSFSEMVRNVTVNGIINFYGVQRFGTPRYLSHYFGSLILSARYEELIKAVLCQISPFEIAYVTNIRNAAASKWGNWQEMDRLFSALPFTFRQERVILRSLMSNTSGNLYINAANSIREQIKFWTRSYAGYLANLLLSEKAKNVVTQENKSETIPLLLSQNPESQKPYEAKLKIDGTYNFRSTIRNLPYLYLSRDAYMPVRVFPEFHQTKILPEGVVLCFSLPKAAYATTVLMSLFNLGSDRSAQFSKNPVDTKAVLGHGSLADIQSHFTRALSQSEPDASQTEEV